MTEAKQGAAPTTALPRVYETDQPPTIHELIANLARARQRIGAFNTAYSHHDSELAAASRDALGEEGKQLQTDLRLAVETMYRWCLHELGERRETFVIDKGNGNASQEVTVELGALRVLRPGEMETLVTFVPTDPIQWHSSPMEVGVRRRMRQGGMPCVEGRFSLPSLSRIYPNPSSASLEQAVHRPDSRLTFTALGETLDVFSEMFRSGKPQKRGGERLCRT